MPARILSENYRVAQEHRQRSGGGGVQIDDPGEPRERGKLHRMAFKGQPLEDFDQAKTVLSIGT